VAKESKFDYGSRFLYAENLLRGGQFHTANVTIAKVHPPYSIKSADKRQIEKVVIEFEESDKLLVLAKTNARIIHYITGEPPGDGWVGHKITVQARIVPAFGEDSVAIRIIPPPGVTIRRGLARMLGVPAEWHPQKGAVPKPSQKQKDTNEHHDDTGRASTDSADQAGTETGPEGQTAGGTTPRPEGTGPDSGGRTDRP